MRRAGGHRRLSRHGLDHREQILRAMRDLAHEKAHMRFALLAFGDVTRRADHAHGLAVREKGAALREYPALDPVADPDDTVFGFIVAVAGRVCRRHERAVAALDIGGIQGIAKKLVSRNGIFRQAPERSHPRIPDEAAGSEVPFPYADLTGLEREGRSLECRFGVDRTYLLSYLGHAWSAIDLRHGRN